MQTSTRGLLALMRREAVVLSTYKDSKGVATIGVGHTAAAGNPAPRPGLKITLVQALSIFRRDIAKYEREVAAAIKVQLAQHEFDALVSFHYNTGGIRVAKLTASINACRRDEATIKAGFRGWLRPPEIEGRRMEEFEQFMFADYGDTSTVPVYDVFPGKVRRSQRPACWTILPLSPHPSRFRHRRTSRLPCRLPSPPPRRAFLMPSCPC